MKMSAERCAADRRIRAIAAAGSCLWVGLFAVLFRPAAPLAYAAVSPSARLLYYPMLDEGGSGFVSPGLWSPRLFSFPSSLGFSAFLETRPNGLRPRLEPLETESEFLAYSAPETARIPEAGGLSAQVRAFFASQPSPYRSLPQAPSGSVFDVRFLEGLSEEDFMDISLPAALSSGEAGWQAQLEIEVQPDGTVSHVFLMNESQLRGNRNLLVQAARKWRTVPSDKVRRGCVTVRSVPPSPGVRP